MEFRVLGPLEVQDGTRLLQLGGTKQRTLLALLLLRANEVVSARSLIDGIWGDAPPGTAQNTLQVYISGLRRIFAESGANGDVIATRRPGYVLRVDAEQIDVVRFEDLLGRGREALAASAPAEAVDRLREALGLWRGVPLADVPLTGAAEPQLARLEEMRLAATEDLLDAELALGSHSALVGELERLVREHPLRERLRAQLMLALYRSGRQAEALQSYRDAVEELRRELGLEPGPSLQRLERAILVHDPALESRAQAAPDVEAPGPRRDVRRTIAAVLVELSAESHGRSLDPESLERALNRSLQVASRSLEEHGGVLDRSRPDALGAFFGISGAHEDDALRAVRGAVSALESVAGVAEELVAEGGILVSARATAETGEVVSHEGGGTARASGAPLLEISRLVRQADAGEVVIGQGTLALVRDAVAVEEVGGGRAWRVVELVAHAEGLRRRFDAPMLGRDRELDHLHRALERAAGEHGCRLVTVLGPAGIGKSRLAEELRRAAGDEARVLAGRCLSYGDGITLWPVAEILRQALGDDVRAGIEELIAGRDDATRIAGLVAAAIGSGEGSAPGEETFWAVRKVLEALAEPKPLVVVLDDLHWAEPTLLDLVDHVADWSRDVAILLVCLGRPEVLDLRPDWAGGKPNAGSFVLEPLTDAECELLIDNLLGGLELSAAIRSRITTAAEGNPLFVEQLLSMLIDDGLLREEDGRWATSAELPDLDLPPSIQALMAARLDRLDPAERHLLERAAVVGRVFWPGAVAALGVDDAREDVGERLESLVRKQLVGPDETSFAGETGYRFRHLLIREAAYRSLPKASRAELHERFANWLETAAGEREREYEELIGYHLEQAHRYRGELGPLDDSGRELALRAAVRLAPAGRRAFGRGDVPAAVNLLGRAVSLLPDGDPRRPETLLDLAEAIREVGDFVWAGSVLDEVLALARAKEDRRLEAHARVVELRIQIQLDPGVTTEELLRGAERAVEVFEETADERGLAKAWFVLAWIPWLRCQAGIAEQALARALEHARAAGDDRAFAHAENLFLGTALFGPLPVGEGVRRCEDLLLAPDTQMSIRASACRALAVLRAMQGDFDAARELVGRDRAILEDLGLRFLAAAACEAYGLVELFAGDPAAADRHLRAGYERLERMGEKSALSTVSALLAQAAYAAGREEDALRYSETAEEAAAREDLSTQVQWRGPRAKVLAARGNGAAAERLAREAVALAARTDFVTMHGNALLDAAEVFRVVGKPGEASTLIDEALALHESKGNAVGAAAATALRKRLPRKRAVKR